MNTPRFLSLLFLLFLFSCTNKNDQKVRTTSGKINAIAVVMDDNLWNGEVGDSIRNKFASPVLGLPQEEPLFSISQYPVKLLGGFVTESRAIIVVKQESINRFQVKKNQFATPQNVFHISGTSHAMILKLIEKNAPKIIQIIKEAETAERQRITKKSLLNTGLLTAIFGISLEIPSKYEYVLQQKNFIWLKKEITSGNMSLLLYQVPLQRQTEINSQKIIQLRDSVGHFIRGKEPNTEMVTSQDYTPYFFLTSLNGKVAYETRGTWSLNNDFMSGPFVNYAVVDRKNKRLLVLEGFCYSPSKEKRNLMQELESIIKSVAIQ